jgi:hypothetical protein
MTLKELRQLLIPYGDDCQIVLWCQPELSSRPLPDSGKPQPEALLS